MWGKGLGVGGRDRHRHVWTYRRRSGVMSSKEKVTCPRLTFALKLEAGSHAGDRQKAVSTRAIQSKNGQDFRTE